LRPFFYILGSSIILTISSNIQFPIDRNTALAGIYGKGGVFHRQLTIYEGVQQGLIFSVGFPG
jgi:hypothetical protein